MKLFMIINYVKGVHFKRPSDFTPVDLNAQSMVTNQN
jgi:hypothetical protein